MLYGVVAVTTHTALNRWKIFIFISVASVYEALGRPCRVAQVHFKAGGFFCSAPSSELGDVQGGLAPFRALLEANGLVSRGPGFGPTCRGRLYGLDEGRALDFSVLRGEVEHCPQSS